MSAGRRLAARLTWVIVLLGLVIGTGVGWVAGPERQRLHDPVSGDRELGARVRALVGDGAGLRSLVVAEVTESSIRWAGLGNADAGRGPGAAPSEQTGYELGSITKSFTGALFADAIERGEVRADDALATQLHELRDSAAGQVSLASLAQHRSGLPPLGATARAHAVSLSLSQNPYADSSTEQLLADAAAATVDPQQPPTYSNFGIALLGTALVRASGAPDYQTLLAQRITGPLKMAATTVAATAADIPVATAPGFAANGLPAPRWPGTGYLPAGTSTVTTVGDLARWAQAQLTGKAPGTQALQPTADFQARTRIGWAWMTTTGPDGGATTWHNGGTAGFRTMLAIDRSGGRAVIVMGNTSSEVDPIAMSLLHRTPLNAPGPDAWSLAILAIPVVLASLFSLAALRRAIRRRSVLPIANALLTAAFGLLLLWVLGPWTFVGGWLWGLMLGPVSAAAVLLAVRARSLPLLPEGRRWPAWIELVLAVALVVFGVMLW